MDALNGKKVDSAPKRRHTLPSPMPDNPTRTEVLTAITRFYEEGDLPFIKLVNEITWGYKVRLQKGRGSHDDTVSL